MDQAITLPSPDLIWRMAYASVENTSDGIAWITEDARIVEANPAYCRFFGYSRDEMITLSIPDIDPNYDARVWPLHWQNLREQKRMIFETQSLTKTGETIDIEVVANLVEFDGREYNCACLRDITQRKQAERQLYLLQTCVPHLNDVVLITEAANESHDAPCIVYVNDAFERMTGYTRSEAIGQTPRILQGPKTSRIELDRIRSAIEKSQPIRAELINYHKNGTEYWIEIDIVPIFDADGKLAHLAAVERDITERKLQEQRKIEFVSTVSHELRTPLTSIRGSLGLLTGGVMGELPEKAMSLARLAHQNSERLSNLINDLLDVQKMDAGMTQFDFAEHALPRLLGDALATNLLFGQQLGVSMEIVGELPDCVLHVDGGRFQQVMSNLLSNACKYSPKERPVQVRAHCHGGRVRIEVCDYGKGIPEAFRQRIFQKFAQADSSDARQKGGTGLGLAISREIVLKMGGEIGYHSLPEQGSTFFVEFPVRPNQLNCLN